MMMTEVRRDRVERAAALLDAMEPGWEDRVDVGRLDLHTYDHCVLGQVYGDDDSADRVYHEHFCRNDLGEAFLFNSHLDAWRELLQAREEELATSGD